MENLILARVLPPFLSSIFLRERLVTFFGGGTFLLCCKKRLEDFYSPKLFFYITAHFCWDSLSLHNASGSFRTGSFSAMLFALFASTVFTGIVFFNSRSVCSLDITL